MGKRLSVAERAILEITNREDYAVYRCPKHGIYAVRRDKKSAECPYKCGHVASEEFGEA